MWCVGGPRPVPNGHMCISHNHHQGWHSLASFLAVLTKRGTDWMGSGDWISLSLLAMLPPSQSWDPVVDWRCGEECTACAVSDLQVNKGLQHLQSIWFVTFSQAPNVHTTKLKRNSILLRCWLLSIPNWLSRNWGNSGPCRIGSLLHFVFNSILQYFADFAVFCSTPIVL